MNKLQGKIIVPDKMSGNIGAKTINIGGGSAGFLTDETLTLKDGILSVNTTDQMEQDNTLPITSAGVHTVVGNIGAILDTI